MSLEKPKIVKDDGWLEPYEKVIRYRQERYDLTRDYIDKTFQSLRKFATWHHHVGLILQDDVWTFTEWLPAAQKVSLVGDFNNWDKSAHPLKNDGFGYWVITLPREELEDGQSYKIHVIGADGSERDRIPSLATYVTQSAENQDFSARVTAPAPYDWKAKKRPVLGDAAPLIYEAHIGISGEAPQVHSYRHFAEEVIPWIVETGYNTIQLMAIAEHPYYGSFGYHVANFYAPSSRFGTPEDFKYLVDTAHQAGLIVLMDIVHSHAVKNLAEGLNNIDGSGGLYFHPDSRGDHPQWDSKCFDYGREEVLQFLLSNLRYWMDEFHIDGFRFDGVTSMLYWHRGQRDFNNYDCYFSQEVDNDAILYLQLASSLIRELNPDALIIAEDMSGMPGLCRAIEDGGVGFTHRLAMGIPDYWIKTLKEVRDEDWDLQELWQVMLNRRAKESHISYVESHDQALVGDKTIAFQLMDQEMYWSMGRETTHPVIERGLALHKLIRLLTMAAGGEGYLTFMGNEFGHPEWLDFPREGNNWSYHYARRQWGLVSDPDLRYIDLAAFDRAMTVLVTKYNFLQSEPLCTRLDQQGRVLAFQRGELLFIFNFSVDQSYEGSEIYLPQNDTWKVILDSDMKYYGGQGRIDHNIIHTTTEDPPRLKLYLPARTVQVLLRQPKP